MRIILDAYQELGRAKFTHNMKNQTARSVVLAYEELGKLIGSLSVKEPADDK